MKWIGTQTVYDSVRFSKRVTFKGSQLIIFEGGLTSNDSIVIGKAVNDGNPFISLGSSLSERLEIKAEYESGAQGLDTVRFTSFTAGTGSDDGRFVFEVDDSFLFAILDDGIKIKASGNLEIGTGNAVLSDSSGTTTLSNIDALDATTIATFETAMEANLDTFGSQMTSASALATVGTIGTGVWNADVIASAYLDTDTAHLTTNQTFTGVKTFTKPILGINAVFYGDIGVTPRDGAKIHVDGATITDTATSASGTADLNTTVSIEAHELVAVNSGVTTTNAATLYIKGAPIAGTNMTLTNAYALWVNSGLVKFDGTLTVDGTITGDVTGDLTGDASGSSGSCTGQAATVATIAGLAPNTATTQATQAAITTCTNLTTVGTVGTGVWQGTAIASAYLDADTAHLSGAQTFTGTKTLNSFKGTAGATVTNILDEDAMGSNSATALATQQSIKAYADTKVSKDTTKQLTHHTFQDAIWISGAAATQVVYISLTEIDAENTNAANFKLPLTAPVAGKLLKAFIRTSHDLSDADLTLKLYTRTVSQTSNGAPAEIGAITATGPDNKTMTTFDFTGTLDGDTGTNAVVAGDKVQISIEASADETPNSNFFMTLLWEWDLS